MNQSEQSLRLEVDRRRGILLYFPGDARLARAADGCKDWRPVPYWGPIEPVATSYEAASNLIPRALMAGSEAWLLLYVIDAPLETLLFPFPFDDDAAFKSTEHFQGYLLALLEDLGTARPNAKWYPSSGFRNLIEFQHKGRVINYPGRSALSFPTRFEVIHTNRPIQEWLSEEGMRNVYVQVQESVYRLENAAQRAQSARRESLRDALEIGESETIATVAAHFDEALTQETARLNKWIMAQDHGSVTLPKVVDHFDRIIDPETVRMLESAIRVAEYASRHAPDRFDFALPGCGLWRAVERELSLSIIWHLRRHFGFAGADPSRPIEENIERDERIRAGDRDFLLNERQEMDQSQFRGVELGTWKHLIKGAKHNNVEYLLTPVLSEAQKEFVFGSGDLCLRCQAERLRRLRNGYAHIQPMDLAHYRELYALVLSSSTQSTADSLLGQILDIKLAVDSYWKRHQGRGNHT